jgi:hypothetical protein
MMATASTAMLNVRMNRATKEAGDSFLAELGISVSELTRALWEKLARGDSEARREVERIMAPGVDAGQAEEARRKRAALDRADESWERLAAMVGERSGLGASLSDDKEALAEERLAYLQEKWGELA